MKRVYKSKEEPELLRQYRLHNPEETWEHFRRRCRRGYKQVREAILRDQHGLCAYCEVGIKLAEEDSRILPILRQKNGVSAARNEGLEKAQGEFIMFVDADDKLDPQMLSVLVPEMVIGRKDNVNIVSWLLTDYRMDTVDQIPELCDEEGNALKRDTRKKEGQEWGVLYKED